MACDALTVALVLGLGAASPGAAATLTGQAEVIDGDTLSLGGVVVRINGIDAAELGQKCSLPSGGKWDCAVAAADRMAGG